MFPLIGAVLTVLMFIDILPPSQERSHWILFVGIRVSTAKFDADDGFSLYFP